MAMRDCPGVSAPIVVGSWGSLVIVMIDNEEEVLCCNLRSALQKTLSSSC